MADKHELRDKGLRLTPQRELVLSAVRELGHATPEEVAEGALEGAQNINFYDADFKDILNKLDKSKPVFVYCRSGGRSGKCAQMCKDAGFAEVYDMKGGWLNYSSQK